MKQWVIQYVRIPTNYNPIEKAVVDAETARDATTILRGALHEDVGNQRYVLSEPVERPAVPDGRVVSMRKELA